MYPVSERFLEEIQHDHTVVSYAEFFFGGDSKGEVVLLGGTITEDSAALIRRRASLQFSPSDQGLMLPTNNNYNDSPLWPIGNEVQVYTGVKYSDGEEEYVPLGLFRISRLRLNRTADDFTIQVDTYDRSRTISRNRFVEPYSVASGTDFATAIKNLLMNRMPFLNENDFVFIKTDGSDGGPVFTTPSLIFESQDDPWKSAVAMARSIGCELFFDGLGRCVLRYQPDPLYTSPVWSYIAGSQALMTQVGRDLDDEEAYNGVIITGENTDNETSVPQGQAWDTNPASPTYYDPADPDSSTYGAHPLFESNQFITNNTQARAAAQARLVAVLGIIEKVDLSAVPNPAHEGGDVISIQELDTGVDSNYLLESFQLGIGPQGSLTGTTRRRRVS